MPSRKQRRKTTAAPPSPEPDSRGIFRRRPDLAAAVALFLLAFLVRLLYILSIQDVSEKTLCQSVSSNNIPCPRVPLVGQPDSPTRNKDVASLDELVHSSLMLTKLAQCNRLSLFFLGAYP